VDPRLDWERDGQYYHYLTRWLHALVRTAKVTGAPDLIRYAAELARAAHRAFRHSGPAGPALYWKMSIDLSRPVVTSMGEHDALDGLLATAATQAAAPAAHDSVAAADLAPELRELAQLCAGRGWATTDALGIGSLLTSALELARLVPRTPAASGQLITRVLRDAARSLDLVTVGDFLAGPAHSRLAFRELGLGIGLAALEHLDQLRRTDTLPGGAEAAAQVERMLRHLPLRSAISSFWLQPSHQAAPTWTEHEDINSVMLGTSLLPDGYLG
jgi:hypothetical protein